jgi:dihydroxyacetone kinase-like protein
MKKIINAPGDYVDEMLEGLCLAHPQLKRIGDDGRTVVHTAGMPKGRVGIATGGGSGHLPLFTGYVGDGLVDSCAVGNVFEGPSVTACEGAIRAADGGHGVLCLFGNYGGDRMNFEMAAEMVSIDGIETATVLGTDDVASGTTDEIEKRRGVAGLIFAYKAAGAMAASGAPLEEVARAARLAVDRTRTIGVALTSCQIPGADAPNFEIGDDEIEMGMGIHGEPGIWRAPLKSADELVDEMLDRLLAETPEGASGRVAVLVNSLGATPHEELYIMYRRLRQRLDKEGLTPVHSLIGPYVTSMEMGGASISLAFLDDELEALLEAPAECPFWTVR